MRQQYVYVLLSPSTRRYKIGRTVNPAQRFRGMQLPEPPAVVGMFPCQDAKYVERELHRRFVAERKHGEWFELTKSRAAELLFWCRVLSATEEE